MCATTSSVSERSLQASIYVRITLQADMPTASLDGRDVPHYSRAGRAPVDARHAVVWSAKRNQFLKTSVHTFFASLLYSSTKSSRFAISSVSDTKSPLFEVQVALL